MRTGTDRKTGAVLTGWAHCLQSIEVILSTAIGSVVMLRDFGSDAPSMQDRPASAVEIARLYMAAAEALRKWEPGFRLTQIRAVRLDNAGAADFELSGIYYPNGHLGDFTRPETKNAVLSL